MTITNTKVVDTTTKYIVQSKGIGNEEDQIVVDAEKLTSGNNESKVNLIECYYQIKGTGTLKFSAESETNDLSLTVSFDGRKNNSSFNFNSPVSILPTITLLSSIL